MFLMLVLAVFLLLSMLASIPCAFELPRTLLVTSCSLLLLSVIRSMLSKSHKFPDLRSSTRFLEAALLPLATEESLIKLSEPIHRKPESAKCGLPVSEIFALGCALSVQSVSAFAHLSSLNFVISVLLNTLEVVFSRKKEKSSARILMMRTSVRSNGDVDHPLLSLLL